MHESLELIHPVVIGAQISIKEIVFDTNTMQGKIQFADVGNNFLNRNDFSVPPVVMRVRKHGNIHAILFLGVAQ